MKTQTLNDLEIILVFNYSYQINYVNFMRNLIVSIYFSIHLFKIFVNANLKHKIYFLRILRLNKVRGVKMKGS